MSPEQLGMLKELQAIEFTCLDLSLYLDTHPFDEGAQADHGAVARQLAELRKAYEGRYGPLTFCTDATAGYPAWVCGQPWPWDIEY